jgi:hypothetical protein
MTKSINLLSSQNEAKRRLISVSDKLLNPSIKLS